MQQRLVVLVLALLTGCLDLDNECGPSQRELHVSGETAGVSASLYLTDVKDGARWGGWRVASMQLSGHVLNARVVDPVDQLPILTMTILELGSGTTISDERVDPYTWNSDTSSKGWHVPFDEARQRLQRGVVNLVLDTDMSATPVSIGLYKGIDSDFQHSGCG